MFGVLPTALGWRWILMSSMLFGVHFVTAYSNPFFMLLCFQGTTLLAAAATGMRTLRGLRVRLQPIAVGAAEEPLPVQLQAARTLPGKSWLELRLEGGWRRVEVAAADEGGTILGSLPGLPRGVHQITGARLVTTAPFGLFRVWRRLLAPPPVSVHPRPSRSLAARLAHTASEGSDATLALARGNSTASVRDYRPGDDHSRVHWKRSARCGTLVVREQEAEARRSWFVALDGRCDGSPAGRKNYEQRLSTLAGLLLMARDRNLTLTVDSQGFEGTFGGGLEPIEILLVWLAAHQPLPMTAAPPPLRPGASLLGDPRPNGEACQPKRS